MAVIMKQIWTVAELVVSEKKTFNWTPSLLAKTTFYYIQSAGYFKTRKGYYTRREGFKSILLLYTLRGKGSAEYRGRRYELNPGQLFVINCYDYQEYYTSSDEGWEIKWVHFFGSNSEEYFNAIYDNYGPVIDIGSEIVDYIDMVMDMMERGDRQFEIKASNIVVNMLTRILLEASSNSGCCESRSQHRQIREAISFIEANYNSNITVQDMAEKACYSLYHFIRVFKKTTDYSPYEYLVKYRINKAKALLDSTDKTIEEISHIVGFDSVSNFVRTFRQLEDMTPLKYRKLWKVQGKVHR